MKKLISLFFILLSLTSFSSENIREVYIDGDLINLKITPYSGDEIILKYSSRISDSIIEKTREDDTIYYKLNISNNNTRNFFSFKTKLELYIPENLNLKYLINTSESNINIDKINGDFFINNLKGKIKIKNTTGNLNIQNEDSHIYITDTVGDIKVIAQSSSIYTKNTKGLLNIKTTNRDITVTNAETIGDIMTSNSKIYANFNNITPTSRVVTTNHNITLEIPENRNFEFSFFGDLIKIKNNLSQLNSDTFLTIGTSNGTISIKENH